MNDKDTKLLEEKNFLANHKIRVMERDMMDKLEDLRNQYIVLNNPNTKRVKIQGNQKAENLKAVAYINPVKKLDIETTQVIWIKKTKRSSSEPLGSPYWVEITGSFYLSAVG